MASQRTSRTFRHGLLVLAAALFLQATSSCFAAWDKAAPMPSWRHGCMATLLSNGKVLVTGGYYIDKSTGGAQTYPAGVMYDPATDTWSSISAASVPRADHAAVLLADGRVLVAGGPDTNTGAPPGSVNNAEIYDPASNSWTSAGSLAEGRDRGTVILLANGKVVLMGGSRGGLSVLVSRVELYDPATNSWSTVGSMSTSRSFFSATLLADGRVLVAGGHDGTSASASVDIFDPASNSWSAAAPLAATRYGHSAVQLASGKVLVLGGYAVFAQKGTGKSVALPRAANAAGLETSMEIYDPATNSWASAGVWNTVRDGSSATLLASGHILAAGGWDAAGDSVVATAELCAVAEGGASKWSSAGKMPHALGGQYAIPFSNGQVFLVGGIAPRIANAASQRRRGSSVC